MRSSTSRRAWRDRHDRRQVLALWTGMLAGPLAWLLLLEWNYVASYVACETRQTWFLHAATLAAVALVAAAGLRAWRAGRGPAEDPHPPIEPVSEATSDARARWMAQAAVASSGWFILVMLSMEVPVIVLRTCQ
jgi:hypothetical protein